MSLIATLALAASTATLPQCSWDKPGANPFMGDVVAAVDRYQDIPAAVRAKLKARMQARQYDEIVLITRDAITGKAQYGSEIRDMHFGTGSICQTVTRSKWSAQAQERGLVYCEDGQCILVPTVCRNVSRIKRTVVAAAPAPQVAAAEPDSELTFEPPGAGVPAGASTSPSFAQLASTTPTTSISSVPTTTPSVLTPSVTPFVPTLPPTTPAVPEPGTWAMLLAGLAAVGWIAKRRSAA